MRCQRTALTGPAALCSELRPTLPPRVTLAVYPPDVNLTTSRDRQSFIVVATRADGVTLDVTAEAKATLANPALAKLEGNTLYPAGRRRHDAGARIRAARRSTLPVKVAQATPIDRPISFKLDVMPVFMRAGCNTGSCHGAARGKDGFNLSLFGFDPDGDYHRITHEIGFRRINLALPRESLLMQKADGTVPHTGGKRFAAGQRVLPTRCLRWLEAGVPHDPAEVATLRVARDLSAQGRARRRRRDAAVHRPGQVLRRHRPRRDEPGRVPDEQRQLGADRRRRPGDGRRSRRSVRHGPLRHAHRRQPGPGAAEGPAVRRRPTTPPANYVDELVNAKLQKIRVLPSDVVQRRSVSPPRDDRHHGPAADGRRVSARSWPTPIADKRAKLVDRLLERKEFSEIWAMKWANLLMVKSSNDVSYKIDVPVLELADQPDFEQRAARTRWCRTCSAPAAARSAIRPRTTIQIERDTLKTAENVAQVFMGIRTQCAQCHNHPFDRWTMDDYYSFAAFFAQIGRKQGETIARRSSSIPAAAK